MRPGATQVCERSRGLTQIIMIAGKPLPTPRLVSNHPAGGETHALLRLEMRPCSQAFFEEYDISLVCAPETNLRNL